MHWLLVLSSNSGMDAVREVLCGTEVAGGARLGRVEVHDTGVLVGQWAFDAAGDVPGSRRNGLSPLGPASLAVSVVYARPACGEVGGRSRPQSSTTGHPLIRCRRGGRDYDPKRGSAAEVLG